MEFYFKGSSEYANRMLSFGGTSYLDNLHNLLLVMRDMEFILIKHPESTFQSEL